MIMEGFDSQKAVRIRLVLNKVDLNKFVFIARLI